MIDIGSAIAVGLSGFLAGMAYANRGHHRALEDATVARNIVIDRRGYMLAEIKVEAPADGGTEDDPERVPGPAQLRVVEGGKGDAA